MGMHLTHRVIIVSFLLIMGMPVARAQEYCAPVVTKRLSQLGVGSERVEEIIYGNHCCPKRFAADVFPPVYKA